MSRLLKEAQYPTLFGGRDGLPLLCPILFVRRPTLTHQNRHHNQVTKNPAALSSGGMLAACQSHNNQPHNRMHNRSTRSTLLQGTLAPAC